MIASLSMTPLVFAPMPVMHATRVSMPKVRMEEAADVAEAAPAPPPPPKKVASKPSGLRSDNVTPNVDWAIVNQFDAAQFATGQYGPSVSWGSSPEVKDQAGLAALAKKLNPAVGFWDPLQIFSESNADNKELIAWYRQAEIKHGRVAMAGFVGFCVQSAGIHFPWMLNSEVSFADISAAGTPADQWDALPTSAKVQILLFVGFLELWSESTLILEKSGQKHYVRGGKPGYFPGFKDALPHPVPFNLFDPFGLTGKLTPQQKETKLLAEINNGRLAMIGLFGLISVSKGCIVPGLDSLPIARYGGEYMAPFAANNIDLPGVAYMVEKSASWTWGGF